MQFTAQQARNITEDSIVYLDRVTAELELEIRAAAIRGEDSIQCKSKDTYLIVDEGANPKPTPRMERLAEKLNRAGYKTSYEMSDPYPRAGNGSGGYLQQYYIRISW